MLNFNSSEVGLIEVTDDTDRLLITDSASTFSGIIWLREHW